MRGYNCPICDASLDPGEKCDCAEKEEACTAATEQASSIKNMQLKIHTDDTTKDLVCQDGGVLT